MNGYTAPGGLSLHRTAASSSGIRPKINGVLAIALSAVIFLAPVALGSNRPLAWTAWAMVIGTLTMVACLANAMSGQALRFGLARIRLETILFACLIGYLVVQVLPIGRFSIPNSAGLDMATAQISIAPGATALMTMRMLTYGLFTFLMLQVTVNASRRRSMLNAILVIVLVHAAYSLIALFQFGDTILGAEKWTYVGSATGTFVNRNSFATFLSLGAAIASANLASAMARGGRENAGSSSALYILALLILLVTVIVTNSRMGLVVWCTATMIPFVCLLIKMQISRPMIAVVTLVTLGALVLVFTLYGSTLISRIWLVGDNLDLRTTLYAQIQQLIASRPWTGFGGGSFENAFHLFHQPSLDVDSNWDRAHNSYLALWSELGLIFGSIPVIIMAALGWRIRRSLVRTKGGWSAQAAALGALAAGAIHSLVDFSLEIQGVTFLFLAICACGLAASVTRRDNDDARPV